MVSLASAAWQAAVAIVISTGALARAQDQPTQPPARAQEFVPSRILVKFKGGVKAHQREAVLAAQGTRVLSRIPQIDLQVLEVSGGTEAAQVSALRGRPEIEFAELDRFVAPADVLPNDPYYGSQPALSQIHCPTAWSTTTGSTTIVIAILDTGVSPTHVDLAPNLVPGWNFYDNNADTSDVVGHGTVVAGTAGAVGNNATGVASVNWSSRLMPIRISDPQGWGSYSLIAAGLVWAADHGARVANISYLLAPNSSVTSAAVYFQSRGGLVITAAGNNGLFIPDPENPYLLTVSAVAWDDSMSSWSNTGTHIDLSAPGSSATTVRSGGYGTGCGTSVSAPYVAGTAALVLSVNPGLTGQQVQDVLKQSADDLGPAGWDLGFGWGRLNVSQAVALALDTGGGEPPPPPPPGDQTAPSVEIATPLDGANVNGNVQIEADASDDVGLVRVEFYVDGTLRNTRNGTPWRYRWRTQNVPAGAHTIQCRAYDEAGNVGVSATITVYR